MLDEPPFSLAVGVSADDFADVIAVLGLLLVGVSAVQIMVALPAPGQVSEQTRDIAWEFSDKRTMAAQSALRGIVMSSTANRETRPAVDPRVYSSS